MEYNFRDIEKKWQEKWKDQKAYEVSNNSSKPKYYVLDMFPYPSGTGLHVGHPLGYIASDIFARYKRLQGYNVLHPMGYDAFGLPAEQYAIDHGIHPAVSTNQNISNFRKQLDNIGFSFDWSREVKTSDPKFYKWTQWIFLKLFESWYNRGTKKAEPISSLISIFEKDGNLKIGRTQSAAGGNESGAIDFSSDQWKTFDEKQRQDILMNYRLAFCGYGEVNWCEALGTVLANDEVINGVSERGGYPVVKKKLRQWYLRITEYADRLLEGLETVEFSESMKEMQTNWIGKSYGAEIDFRICLTPERSDPAHPQPLSEGEGSNPAHPQPLSEGEGVSRLTPVPSPHGEGGSDIDQPDQEDSLSGNYYQTASRKFWKFLKEYSRENRKNATEAKDRLWQKIRNNQLGVKARRQHAVGEYIVDFVLMEIKLAIEIDGTYHEEKEQKEYDEARTEYLKEFGIDVLRFTNEEVLSDIESVLNKISIEIKNKKSSEIIESSVPLLRAEKGLGDEAGEVYLKVYTTRPDTIFGVDFMVIAPEHELVENITTTDQKKSVEDYLSYVKSRSERERMAEKKISGVFTGAYAENPFNGRKIPIWISEYVLAGYGTGAIMAVPCGDERDHKFAKHFTIPITNIIGSHYDGIEANATKDAILENSDFLNGMVMRDAIEVVIQKLESMGIGTRKVNYKMRDAAFSRQRYWGEPFPIVWKNGIAIPLSENELPVVLPHLDELKPGPDAEGPLANLDSWKHYNGGIREVNTMPGYAGSSWYFLRYMDPHNEKEFCSRKVSDYWGQVDLYIGGTEHAVGHLLYSRMWTKVLFDLGFIGYDEPYRKLVNQGMIQGSSRFVYRFDFKLNEGIQLNFENPILLSAPIAESFKDDDSALAKFIVSKIDLFKNGEPSKLFASVSITRLHIDVNVVSGLDLDIAGLRKWRAEYENAYFIMDDGSVVKPGEISSHATYTCGAEVEKMSKRYYNVVNPDDIVIKYGADTYRMYEMFLGPVEQSKPWETKGIEGVHRFLKKLWRLFYDDVKGKVWNEQKAIDAELKILHKSIKKIGEDTERFSFNTGVSAFMICVNELSDAKCNKKEILEPLLILLAPYAPHVAEELWHYLGNTTSILEAAYPKMNGKFLVETSKNYPVSVNGKVRTQIDITLDASQQDVEQIILENEIVKKWLNGGAPKKIIYVKNKMINVVM